MKDSSRSYLVVSERTAFYLFVTLSFLYFILYFLLTPFAYYFFDGNFGYVGGPLNKILSDEVSFLLIYSSVFFLGSLIPFSFTSCFRKNSYFFVRPLPLNLLFQSLLALFFYIISTISFLHFSVGNL